MWWNWIKKEEVEKMLHTKSVQEVADHYGISKACMYKFTSMNKIDVWKIKRVPKKKSLSKTKLNQINQEKYFNVVYGYLTKDTLQELLNKYTAKQICILFKITRPALKHKAKKWNLSLKNNIPKNPKIKSKAQLVCLRCGKKFNKLSDTGLCYNCVTASNLVHETPTAETRLGKDIIDLSTQGMTYSQIAKQLGCSKSTVSYYISKNGKETTSKRHKSYVNSDIGYFVKRLSSFKCRTKGKGKNQCKDYNKRIRTSVSYFRNRKPMGTVNNYYTYTEAIEHLGGWQTKCYLTGRPIDIKKDEYALDHIVPASKGGTNELSNMGITIPQANQMKSDLTVDELLLLCKEILIHHNYKVEDPT